MTITVTFNTPPEEAPNTKIFSGFPGFVNGESLGGSVTIEAEGLGALELKEPSEAGPQEEAVAAPVAAAPVAEAAPAAEAPAETPSAEAEPAAPADSEEKTDATA